MFDFKQLCADNNISYPTFLRLTKYIKRLTFSRSHDNAYRLLAFYLLLVTEHKDWRYKNLFTVIADTVGLKYAYYYELRLPHILQQLVEEHIVQCVYNGGWILNDSFRKFLEDVG